MIYLAVRALSMGSLSLRRDEKEQGSSPSSSSSSSALLPPSHTEGIVLAKAGGGKGRPRLPNLM